MAMSTGYSGETDAISSTSMQRLMSSKKPKPLWNNKNTNKETFIIEARISADKKADCHLSIYNGFICSTYVYPATEEHKLRCRVKSTSETDNVHSQHIAVNIKVPEESDDIIDGAPNSKNGPDSFPLPLESDFNSRQLKSESENSEQNDRETLELACFSEYLSPIKNEGYEDLRNKSSIDPYIQSTSSCGSSETEEDENNLISFTPSSRRPQRSIKRRVYRRKDIYSSEEDEESFTDSPPATKKKRGRIRKKSVERTKIKINKDSSNGKKRRGRPPKKPNDRPVSPLNVEQDTSIVSDKEHSVDEYIPDEHTSDRSLLSNPDLSDNESSKGGNTTRRKKRKKPTYQTLEMEIKDILVKREEMDKSLVDHHNHNAVESVELLSLPDNVSFMSNAEKEDSDSDTSETAEDILRSMIEQNTQLPKTKNQFTSYKVCALHSEHLKQYSYARRIETQNVTCYICGWNGFGNTMLLHLYCMHIESTRHIDNALTRAKQNGVRVTSLPEPCDMLDNYSLRCLICRDTCGLGEYRKHFDTKHKDIVFSNKYKDNFGANACVINAMERNLLEFDNISGTYFCVACVEEVPQPLLSVQNASRHVLAHDTIARKCSICDESFTDIDTHIRENHSEQLLYCDLCQFCSIEKTAMNEHMRVCHPIQLKCSHGVCQKSFCTEGALRRHIITSHIEEIAEPNVNFKGMQGKDGDGLMGGKDSAKSAWVTVSCSLCGQAISGPLGTANGVVYKVSDHIEDNHQDYLATIPKIFLYPCKMCNKLSARKKTYRMHKVFCEGPRRCFFESCNKEFWNMGAFRNHFYDFHKQLTYKCTKCERIFVNGSKLTAHMRTAHAANNSFVCPVCGQGFKRTAALKVHSLIHTGEKPLKCDYCDFRGRQRNNITAHMKVHHKDKLVQKNVPVPDTESTPPPQPIFSHLTYHAETAPMFIQPSHNIQAGNCEGPGVPIFRLGPLIFFN